MHLAERFIRPPGRASVVLLGLVVAGLIGFLAASLPDVRLARLPLVSVTIRLAGTGARAVHTPSGRAAGEDPPALEALPVLIGTSLEQMSAFTLALTLALELERATPSHASAVPDDASRPLRARSAP